MPIDSNNPVVKICTQGIQAEMSGNKDEALKLYMKAWVMKSNDYEACIVAHYVARLQKNSENILLWNQEALKFADLVNDESVAAFYPSLYLNVGKAYEDLGNTIEAKKYYELGISKAAILPNDKLGNMTADALKRGLQRIR